MSTFFIDDIEVCFPFPQAYPEQIEYMTQLKLSLDAGGPCVLEMPSGTGKTVCLLSLILAYMSQRENAGPLIYCTRTIPEMNQGIEELKRVCKHRREKYNQPFDNDLLAICLARRYYLCVNQDVAERPTKQEVDVGCRARTIRTDEKHCDFFDHQLLRPRPGVYSLNEIRQFGVANGLCPYYLTKRLISEATVIFCSFAYTLDPGASETIFKTIHSQGIVVFDEAHNIDDIACEFMSMYVDQPTLDLAAIGVDAAKERDREIREREKEKLQKAFDKMKDNLKNKDFVSPETLEIFSHRNIPEHILKKALPSSIRDFDDFIDKSRKLIRFLTSFIQGSERPTITTKAADALMHGETNAVDAPLQTAEGETERYSPNSVLGLIYSKTGLDASTLIKMPEQLSNFIVGNKLPDYEKYAALVDVLEFASLIGEFDQGFTVFVENMMQGPVMQMACLDPTFTFKPVVTHFQRVVITSGTLSPLSFYPKMLEFEPVTSAGFTMSFSRQCLLPIIASKGYMNAPLTSSYKQRSNPNVAIGYGLLLLEMCKTVPDGIVAYFPSYIYMHMLLKEWMSSEIMSDIMKYKLVFIETPNAEETDNTLANFRNSCDNGRGAVLLGVARGRVSEGIDFSDHYGRCCILFGLPVRNTTSIVVQARADYLEKKIGVKKEDFLVFDAMRAASQCIGRLLRSKKDYGVVIMADRRYARKEVGSQLPHWINEFLDNRAANGSNTDEAIDKTREFMLQMAQPFVLDISKLKRMSELKGTTATNDNDQKEEMDLPDPDPLLS